MSIEETKQQILRLVKEIAKLAQSDISDDDFYREFLNRVVVATGAAGGGIWTANDAVLKLNCGVRYDILALDEDEKKRETHFRLIAQSFAEPNTVLCVPPQNAQPDGSPAENQNDATKIEPQKIQQESQQELQPEISQPIQLVNDTPFLLVLCPLHTEHGTIGLVEMIFPPTVDEQTQHGIRQFLPQVCSYAVQHYLVKQKISITALNIPSDVSAPSPAQQNQSGQNTEVRQALWAQIENFARVIHRSLDIPTTAYSIANESRRLLECDRVSVALRRGGKCRIAAVSGQDIVDKRSTTVRLLGKLAGAVVKAEETIWYTGDTSDFAPQIESAIENYVDESHCKTIAVYPLARQTKEEDDTKRKRQKPEKPFGALIVEQIEDSSNVDVLKNRLETVVEHSRLALGNALEHHSVFLMPLWKFLGKSKILVAARNVPITALVSILLVALIGVLVFLPWKFQIYCGGTLEPVIRRKIYSPLDAEVKQLFVGHHSPVQGPSVGADGVAYRGTTLVELRSSQLDSTDVQLHGEQQEVTEQIASLTRKLQDQDRRLTDYEKADLTGQMERAKIKLETIQQKIDVFETQEKPNLFITSPIDGVVVSWDIQQRLTEKRPISRMQYVLEVADLSGAWQLELAMPEKRIGYMNGSPNVEFILATDPSKKYSGKITEIHDRAEVRTDTGSASNANSGLNTVLIKVAVEDQESLPNVLRPGAECQSRIDCGTKPLGYVLFYELIAFVEKNIIFRWF
ncbi:hemolysin D [Planctomycetales bacterium]|nr:hemolysin D [Planctomycetales bacterium]